MANLKIGVIIASTREGRFGDKPAHWIHARLKEDTSLDVELLDLREYPLPFFNEPISPSMITAPYANPQVQQWTAKVREMDAFVIVTPEYNHGYPAVLKNALDYVQKEWHDKPVSFIAYGSVGGARAVEQLRQVAVELQMAPLKYAIHLPWEVLATISKDPEQNPGIFDQFNEKADSLIKQLTWWGNALKNARAV